MKARLAADQRGGNVARLQGLHGLHEDVGQAVGRPHADVAAAHPVAIFGDFARHGREVGSRTDTLQGRQRPVAPLDHLGDAGAVGNADEDLGDVVLGLLAHLGAPALEQVVDLGVADLDPAHDLALAHPLDQHLVADVVAELRVGDALAAQPLAQLRHRQLVLRRDVGHRAIELDLVDANAALARVGDQHAFVDELVEHLLAQLGGRRQRDLASSRVVPHPGQPLLELAIRHELLVDDGDDVVGALRRRRGLPPGDKRRQGEEGSAAEAGATGRKRGTFNHGA